MDSAIITAVIGVVGAVVGGLIVLAGTVMAENFQRERDIITHTRQLAENRRARLVAKYEAVMLAAQEFWHSATAFARNGQKYRIDVYSSYSGMGPVPEKESYETRAFREAEDARTQFVKAYTPLILEADEVDILAECQEMFGAYATYVEQLEGSEQPTFDKAAFDKAAFDKAYHELIQELRRRKAELENIP